MHRHTCPTTPLLLPPTGCFSSWALGHSQPAHILRIRHSCHARSKLARPRSPIHLSGEHPASCKSPRGDSHSRVLSLHDNCSTQRWSLTTWCCEAAPGSRLAWDLLHGRDTCQPRTAGHWGPAVNDAQPAAAPHPVLPWRTYRILLRDISPHVRLGARAISGGFALCALHRS